MQRSISFFFHSDKKRRIPKIPTRSNNRPSVRHQDLYRRSRMGEARVCVYNRKWTGKKPGWRNRRTKVDEKLRYGNADSPLILICICHKTAIRWWWWYQLSRLGERDFRSKSIKESKRSDFSDKLRDFRKKLKPWCKNPRSGLCFRFAFLEAVLVFWNGGGGGIGKESFF